MQPHVESIVASDLILGTPFRFDDPEQCLDDGRLASPSSPYDSYSLISGDVHIKVSEDKWEPLSVPG